ncbi:MAG TPA: hypothetical protein VGM94_05315 [Galbitalea sp.]|jgi:hypothetical protein
MQLGTRWSVGDMPPARLPDQVVDAIERVESGLGDVDTTGWRWTLTWLEQKPVVELDDGTVIRLGPGGTAVVETPVD